MQCPILWDLEDIMHTVLVRKYEGITEVTDNGT